MEILGDNNVTTYHLASMYKDSGAPELGSPGIPQKQVLQLSVTMMS
jgi:hypothetical protein